MVQELYLLWRLHEPRSNRWFQSFRIEILFEFKSLLVILTELLSISGVLNLRSLKVSILGMGNILYLRWFPHVEV